MEPDPAQDFLQFFAYEHLPAHLQAVSKPFGDMAVRIVYGEGDISSPDFVAPLPRNDERTMALRKLLEAKDCAVRAVLFKGSC